MLRLRPGCQTLLIDISVALLRKLGFKGLGGLGVWMSDRWEGRLSCFGGAFGVCLKQGCRRCRGC